MVPSHFPLLVFFDSARIGGVTPPFPPMNRLLTCFFGSFLLWGCKPKAEVAEVASDWERVQTKFPPPMVEGTVKPYPRLPMLDLLPELPLVALARPGYANLVAGKPVTSSDRNPIIGSLALVTDGDKKGTEGTLVELRDGLQWVQLDLGGEVPIDVIWIWHRSGMDNAAYLDVIVEVSNDPDFKEGVVQVFNNDFDNSSGHGRGKDHPYTESRYGKPIQANGVTGRYVRCYSNGNSWNNSNHYVEVEVFGRAATVDGGLKAATPVDPMTAAFKSFEKDFWAEAAKRDLIRQNADGLGLVGGDELVIRIFKQEEGKRLQEKLEPLMQLANERWNQHHLTPPLRKIEIRSEEDRVLSSVEPGGGKTK